MKIYGVIISQPREEDRKFIVLAVDERHAEQNALDHVDAELCSIKIVSAESILIEHDGCVEAGWW